MIIDWQSSDTTTHQDHVIAHVIGTSVVAHFVLDEALHLVLDIGFIWTVFLDMQMALLPQGVAVAELDIDDETRGKIQGEIDLVLSAPDGAELSHLTAASPNGAITAVELFERDRERRLILVCEENNLATETSLTTAEIKIL